MRVYRTNIRTVISLSVFTTITPLLWVMTIDLFFGGSSVFDFTIECNLLASITMSHTLPNSSETNRFPSGVQDEDIILCSGTGTSTWCILTIFEHVRTWQIESLPSTIPSCDIKYGGFGEQLIKRSISHFWKIRIV